MSSNVILSVQNLEKFYNGRPAVAGISLSLVSNQAATLAVMNVVFPAIGSRLFS